MDVNSSFSGLNFRQNMIKSGSKISGGADPIIKVNSTYNSFTLSEKALALLGIMEGDYVQLYDMAGVEGVVDESNRYYISAGFKYNGVQQGAKIGKHGNFTFNKAWGAMILGDINVKEITGDQLVARDLAILREMELKPKEGQEKGTIQKGYIAKKKGIATLVPYAEGVAVEVADGISVPMFLLSDLKFQEHDPQIEDENE